MKLMKLMSKKIIVVLFLLLIALGITYFWGFFETDKRLLSSKYSDGSSDNKSKSFLISGDPDIMSTALSIDEFLNESDRSPENKLRLQNHSNFLNSVIRIRHLKENNYSTIEKEDLVLIVQTLIFDAYMTNELRLGNIPTEQIEDWNSIRIDLLPVVDNLSKSLREDYVKYLREKIIRASTVLDENIASELVGHFRTFSDLIFERKQHSDVTFQVLLKSYLRSSEYSTESKVKFVQQFLDAGDLSFARRALEFFQDDAFKVENNEGADVVNEISDKIKMELDK